MRLPLYLFSIRPRVLDSSPTLDSRLSYTLDSFLILSYVHEAPLGEGEASRGLCDVALGETKDMYMKRTKDMHPNETMKDYGLNLHPLHLTFYHLKH